VLETRRRLRSSPSSSPLISQDHNETLYQRNGPSQRSQILQGGESRNASPVCPLLPLLSFCSNFFAASVRRQRPSLPNVTRPNGNLSKDHPGTPIQLAFVTFASICSNFFADFCPPSKTKPTERYTPKREFVEGPSRNANPVGPLLPLLPSVQISLLTSVRRQKPSLPNATRPNRHLSKDHPGTPIPLALCYLCFLLFKFLC
jgi:hypothetical protein